MLKPSPSLVLCLAMGLLAVGCLSVDQRVIDGRDLGTAAPFYPGLHYLYGDVWFAECRVPMKRSVSEPPRPDPVGLERPLLYSASLLLLTLPEAVFDTILLPCDGIVWLCCAEK